MADEQTSSMIVSSSENNEHEVSGNTERIKHSDRYTNDEARRRDFDRRDSKRDTRDNRSRSRKRHRSRSRDKKLKSHSRERHMNNKNSEPKQRKRNHSRETRKKSRTFERRRSRSRGDKRRESKSRHGSVELKKEYKYWDVPPTGYEHMSPAEFKAMQAAGQVLPTLYTTEGGVVNSEPIIDNQQLQQQQHPSIGSAVSRQARRIYVGNIPLGVTEQGMMDFFNEQMKLKLFTQADGDPIIAVQINTDKNFAFLEFRSVEETSQGLNLDSIMYNGFPLKLRRPRDYVPLPTTIDTMLSNSLAAGVVQDTPHKLFIGGLPHYLNEDQVKELLLTFGPLSGFNLVKDSSTGLSKGYAFCEYADHSVTDKACLGLTGMQLGEKRIVVQRASLGAKNPTNAATTALLIARQQQLGMDPTLGCSGQETEILCLHNMITPDELTDDEEYEEIVEDVKEECSKYGTVNSLQIPRPTGSNEDDSKNGVGKIYVEFSSKSETVKAMKALAGRTFSGRVVVTSFYDPERYRNGFF